MNTKAIGMHTNNSGSLYGKLYSSSDRMQNMTDKAKLIANMSKYQRYLNFIVF